MDAPPIPWQGSTPDDEAMVGQLVSKVEDFEQGIGKDFRDRCNHFYRQYRGFRQFAHNWIQAGRNDRDGMLWDAKRNWGAHLHIPLSFRTIETVVPKAIANSPRMIVSPRDEQWRKNVETVKLLIDRQQDQIDIDLAFQAVMRAGRIYGLGVGKSYWRTEVINTRKLKRQQLGSGYIQGKMQPETTFDDPMFEDVDVFDFMWDPYGSDPRTCEWICHRIWMSAEQVNKRIEEKVWNTDSVGALNADEVSKLGPGMMAGLNQKYDEVWRDRMEVSGFSSAFVGTKTRGDAPHELLEFHDGERVWTVLDRRVLVQEAENPCCGYMPFQIYRPTPVGKMFVGIGDLEPLEHLQRELDTLRSQRRDAASMVLAAGWIYDDQMVKPEHLVFGPNSAIPVRGNPNEAMQQIQTKDVPGSGYQEEAAIRTDIASVSGESDSMESPGVTGTATEANLVQAAHSARIQLGSRRFEIEVVRHSGRCFLALDQRMIAHPRPALLHPEDGMDPQEAASYGVYKQYPVGPSELEGEFEIGMEGGSMAARNIPQDRADANQLASLTHGNFFLDPVKPLLRILELSGVKHPKAWLKAENPTIPSVVLDILKSAGVDPTLIEQALLRARTVSSPDEGPGVSEVTSALGGQSAPPAPSTGATQ